jgi:phage terminase large subunit
MIDDVINARIERLQRLKDNPADIQPLIAHYKDNPVDFINDWGMTFDPRNAEIGQPTLIPFTLFPKQAEFINWLRDRWLGREDGLCEKSRDMGVSWLCVAFAVWMWRFYDGAVIGFGSRKEDYVDKIGDPKSLFWKVRQFVDLLPVVLRPEGYDSIKNAPFMRITNPENGAAIVGEAGDNIGRGNRTSIYFKDESAFYERPEAIDAALSQTSNCKIDVSTPNGVGNPFYRKRHGGKIPVFVFDWHDDPRKDQAWYDKQCESLDAVIVAQEIDRNYSASVSNSWIPAEDVTAAMNRGVIDVQAVGEWQIGVDVARFGDDKTVITFRKGRLVLPMIKLAKLDTADVYGRVKDAVMGLNEPFCQIAVDDIGVGGGVTDMLRRDFGSKVVGVNSALRLSDGQNYNLRARMWRDMKEYVKTCKLPNDPDLQVDLTALQYTYKAGELLLESKQDAKKRGVKSPDMADSLALTFAQPVANWSTEIKYKRYS